MLLISAEHDWIFCAGIVKYNIGILRYEIVRIIICCLAIMKL